MNARLPCPCLAVDALQALPWSERIEAYADFDEAISNWQLARASRRAGDYYWRLDMRRARRAWKRYVAAVRAAQAGRMVA